jgi:hypothetical protein
MTDIHALSEIRNHDPSVRTREGISCPRPLGHCDRQFPYKYVRKFSVQYDGIFSNSHVDGNLTVSIVLQNISSTH